MEYLRELFQGLRARDALCMGGYALYMAFGYMSFESPTVLASLGEQMALAQPLFLTLAITGKIVTYLAMGVAWLIASRKASARFISSAHMATLTIAVALAGLLLTRLSFEYASYAPFDQAMPWLMTGGFLFGAGSALANLMWARFASTFGLRQVYLFTLLSCVLSLLVYFVITLLPAVAIFPVGIVMFVGSAILAALCLNRTEPPEEHPTRQVMNDALSSLWHPLLCTALLYFMSALMLQIPHNQELTLSEFQNTALITQGALDIALLLPALLVRHQPNLDSIYKLALPLVATGFLLLPIIWSGAGGIANACAQLGAGIAGTILWCMAADRVHATKIPAYLLLSSVMVGVNVAQLIGTLVGLVFSDSMGRGGLTITVIALAAVYLIAMMSMFLFKDRKLKGTDAATGVTAEQEQARRDREAQEFSLRCQAIARVHGLTQREQEILEQLAHGHTVKEIADAFCVSANTVKYHVKGVYQKLGVHSRDEVAEMVSGATGTDELQG